MVNISEHLSRKIVQYLVPWYDYLHRSTIFCTKKSGCKIRYG